MRFREWLSINESGHILLKQPKSFMVMLHGAPTKLQNVQMIDPRFEFSSLRGSSAKKFLGESPFSLPIVDRKGNIIAYIVSSDRLSMMAGNGVLKIEPEGVVAPLDWAEKAQIISQNGEDLIGRTYGAAQKLSVV